MPKFWVDRGRRLVERLKLFGISMVWALLLTLLMLLPEWILSRVYNGFAPYWEWKMLVIVYLLNLFIVNSYYRRTAISLCGYLYFLQLTALIYYRYFGSFYGPTDVMLLFLDTKEMVVSLLGILKYILLPLLVVGATFAIFITVYRRVHGRMMRSRASFVLLLLMLAAPVINAGLEDNSQHYEPDSTHTALRNALNSVSYFLGGDLPKRLSGDYTIRTYQPYAVTPVARAGKYHVVLIMGESLSSTHMSLYGYERETTPFLDRMRDEGRLIYRHGISAAVSTRVSVPMFMNVQYEPDNWKHIADGESSLFRLARQAGFQTAFLSNQIMDGISSLMSSSAIEFWRDARDGGDCHYDDCLVDFMKQTTLDWNRPAFIVLNQRSAHSPYKDNYPRDFAVFSRTRSADYARFKIDSYDDAVRYIDHNLEQIVDWLKSTSPLPVVVVMTSDHGEKVGEQGRFGHNTLDFASARVPALIMSVHGPSTVLQQARALPPLLPHFEIARYVARLLGYRIDDPNQVDKQYYLNGVDLMGRAGYVSYHLADLPEYSQLMRRSSASTN